MMSIWSDSVTLPSFKELKKNISTDVLIIGGGITGILCAYMLDQAGIDYTLVEASTICNGVTKNTTAKITSQHGLIYHKIMNRFDTKSARMYLEANEQALEGYRQLCRHIDCAFETKDAFVYSLDDSEKIRLELDALKKIGFPAEYAATLELPFSTAGAIKFSNQAQFHPLQFLAHIAEGLRIYEHTMVPGFSFRNYQDLLFVGGGDHRTGKRGGSWMELYKFAQKYYPNAKEVYRWSTQDCMTLDGFPYIGHYSLNTPHLYVATGFNKWGMTSAMVAATLLRDMMLGQENPYAPIFSPSRTMLRPQLAVNAFEAATNLLTFSTKRCPHMGCVLKWNPHEHSWDCPCHGSRFTKEGKLIDNPAMHNLKI